MAVQTFVVTLNWENGNAFQMSTKEGDATTVVDVKVEENGHISDLWSGVQSACLTRFNNKLSVIGKEMRS